MHRVVSAAGDFLLNLVALAAAGFALDDVAVSVTGAVLAAAMIAAGQVAIGAATDHAAQQSPLADEAQAARGCAFGLLFLLSFLAPIPLLIFVEAALPGVVIRGTLAYIFTFAALYAVALIATGAYVLWGRLRKT